MAGIKFEIKGDRQLRAKLLEMTRLPRPQINLAMKDALEIQRTQAEQNARPLRQPGNPRGGHLDENIVSVAMPELSSRTRFVWWVSFKRRGIKIAHLVEFGTAPHDQPRRGIRHPGARPKPFLRPAFDETRAAVSARLAFNIRNFIFGGK